MPIRVARLGLSGAQPLLDGGAQELLERKSGSPDDEGASGREGRGEIGQPGEGAGSAPAPDLDGHDSLTGTNDEIDFTALVTPVEQVARACSSRVREVRSHRRLDEPAAELRVLGLSTRVIRSTSLAMVVSMRASST